MFDEVEEKTGMIVTRVEYGRSGHPLTQIQPWTNFLANENYLNERTGSMAIEGLQGLRGRIIVGGYTASRYPFWLYMTQSESSSISHGFHLVLNSVLKEVQKALDQLPKDQAMRFASIQNLTAICKTLYPDCSISLGFVYELEELHQAAGFINHDLAFIISDEEPAKKDCIFDRPISRKGSLGLEVSEQGISGSIKIPSQSLKHILNLKTTQSRYDFLHDRYHRKRQGFFKTEDGRAKPPPPKFNGCCIIC